MALYAEKNWYDMGSRILPTGHSPTVVSISVESKNVENENEGEGKDVRVRAICTTIKSVPQLILFTA
jgi:hypothetical protein